MKKHNFPKTPKALGRIRYKQPIDPQQEIRFMRPGRWGLLVIATFGFLMGCLLIYGFFAFNKEWYTLVMGMGFAGMMAWVLWDTISAFNQVEVGFVCEKGVGRYTFHADGRLLKTKTYAFAPATTIKERTGRSGRTWNMRNTWTLEFRQGLRVCFKIVFMDIGRDGYGGALPDDCDRIWYLEAKEAFLKYQAKNRNESI